MPEIFENCESVFVEKTDAKDFSRFTPAILRITGRPGLAAVHGGLFGRMTKVLELPKPKIPQRRVRILVIDSS